MRPWIIEAPQISFDQETDVTKLWLALATSGRALLRARGAILDAPHALTGGRQLEGAAREVLRKDAESGAVPGQDAVPVRSLMQPPPG